MPLSVVVRPEGVALSLLYHVLMRWPMILKSSAKKLTMSLLGHETVLSIHQLAHIPNRESYVEVPPRWQQEVCSLF